MAEGSAQALSLEDRRLVATWAADCAERVLGVFESAVPDDERPRDAVARARSFGRGERDAAEEIRRRFVAGRAAQGLDHPAAAAAARSAAQAAGVAHMGAHALGAAAYAAKAVALVSPHDADAVEREREWQVDRMSAEVRSALRRLPLLGVDSAGPLGPGLLASGALGEHIRKLQQDLG